MKFIHFTDTHLVAPGKRLHGLDPCARLDACIESMSDMHGDAVLCVHTGDIADGGDPLAYAALRERLSALPMPVHLIVGNHDDREAFLHAFPDAPLDGHGFVQSAVPTEAGVFLLLDTLEPEQGSGGAYCERRMEWLEARLEEARDETIYVFMHHPPFAIGLKGLDAMALEDPEPIGQALLGAGDVRHLFFGHVHRPISGQWHGISFSTLYGTNHQVRFDMEAGSPLPYTAEPPAYSVVLLEPDRVVVHTHHYTADQRNIRDPA